MDASQRRDKADFNACVRATPSFARGDYIFHDKPQRKSTKTAEDDAISRKLLPTTTGPFKVLKADEMTVTILNGTLHDTVSIDCVTRDLKESNTVPNPAQTPDEVTPTGEQNAKADPPVDEAPARELMNTAPTTRKRSVLADPVFAPPPEDVMHPPEVDEENSGREWVVDKIIGQSIAENGTPIVLVRWYGFREPTWEPAANIPYKFIAHYRSRMCKTDTRS
ncbi:hypothetical protein BWQ96_07017 [Gracilariopsis chorda]|uniref:Chromo domain-containing protein n=1 Tax=Gracilariopsis chorda TaxID=448386 RepID=A0A2V3IMD9_9FLOR|nr:hypothetical protein BWQ96_07017 [Gracilariopsis chorda]|eukprot:PXF43244.1 hypothetical protein BWQ96_07017 [Gracilariopsis chorda]